MIIQKYILQREVLTTTVSMMCCMLQATKHKVSYISLLHRMEEWEWVVLCTSCTTHDYYILIYKFSFNIELNWRLILTHVRDFTELQITERNAIKTVKFNGIIVLVQTSKVNWGVEVQLHLLSISSCSGCFTPQKRAPEYPLNTRLGESQIWSACFGEAKSLLSMLGTES